MGIMRAFRSVTGRSPKAAKKTLKEVEEEFESNAGFDPEDPVSRKGSRVATLQKPNFFDCMHLALRA